MKRHVLLLCTTLILIFLSACSGNTGGGNAGGEQGKGSGTGEVKEEQVTITYWVDPRFQRVKGMEKETENFGDFEKIQAQKFMDLHPNVKIEVQSVTWDDLPKKIPAAIAAGSQPDILRDYLGRTAQYAHQGVLENLETLLPKEELDDYIPSYLELYKINGELHALPTYAWASGLVVNKTIWKEKGKESLLPTADNPYWTLEQFDEAMRAVAEKDKVYPFGIQVAVPQGDHGLYSFFNAFGAKLFKDGDHSKVALNSPEGVKALKYMIQLNDEGLLQPSAVTAKVADLDLLFWQNQLGAQGDTLGQWSKLENAKAEGKVKGAIDLAMVQLPNDEGVSNGVPVGPTGLAVFKQKDESKKKWIAEFLMFLNSTENQITYAINAGQFPVKKSAGNPLADDPNYGVLQKIIDERGVEDLGLTVAKYAEIRVLLQPEIQAALLKAKTPEQALADYEKAANKILSGK
ncbi:extracellular solute-binding protein [Paenibacillus sp. GCM10027626]|uniref:extracellular solute-binding protein n=1 Tax=Paenibacillus sp. GCM10027626 TaxID=3273411 RepID=UPI0036426340